MANAKAKRLPSLNRADPKTPTIGVFATSDPRIDKTSRVRCQNIIEMAANSISGNVCLPDKTPVEIVYSAVLIDGEREADIVAQQFRKAGVDILVCVPDTWAFPQLTLISLLQQFPDNTPINITCGNSAPKPGVVIFGHDSMGMETALAHILPTRNTFGIEITRLDMKLLADMLNKKAYNKKELVELRKWLNRYVGDRIELRNKDDDEKFNQSLAMYLINRDLMKDLNAVGGGFMSQLEWGSDPRGIPLPVADVMESLFNSTFDHNGPKAPVPYATEADVQGLLTMLFMTYLSGGNSVNYISPSGIEGIAARLCYNTISNLFSMVWDEAYTAELPKKLADAVCKASTPTWPHTFVVPKYASMLEYKQFAPANHFHMTWNLKPSRLEYWMDLINVLSITPWQKRPKFIEEVDRPMPLIYLQNGGEENTKFLRRIP